MNDEFLKNNGKGIILKELLVQIRGIRTSKKIYATSVAGPRTEVSNLFSKTVQNKMHWAAHGQTAIKKIYYSADADKPYIGMLSFKGV